MNPPALRSFGLRAAILALVFTVAITEGGTEVLTALENGAG